MFDKRKKLFKSCKNGKETTILYLGKKNQHFSNVLLQLQYVLSEDRTMEFQVSKHVYSIVFLQYKADRLTKMQVKTVIDLNFYMNTFSNLYL